MDNEVKYYLYDPKYRKYGASVDSCKGINIIPDDDSIPINKLHYYIDKEHILSKLKFLENANLDEAYSPINKAPFYYQY